MASAPGGSRKTYPRNFSQCAVQFRRARSGRPEGISDGGYVTATATWRGRALGATRRAGSDGFVLLGVKDKRLWYA